MKGRDRVNKKILSIIILAVVLVGGLYYFTMVKGEETTEELVPENNVSEETNSETNGEDITEDFVPDISIGEEAPNFTLKNLDGEEVSLTDYRGKTVLINFWATWCKYCDIEMPDLQKLDKENEDLVVLAVDVMEKKSLVEEYIAEGGYDFQVVLDEDGDIAKLYLVSAFPTSYFVDKDGILLGGVPGMMTYAQMSQIVEGIRDGE
ncbi:Alkyl hydroperoxide reductase/ Thiol specific antioxidant/ Mal allergen [[Clostridium] ultunense Esp]|uniref:Alkyl hydroperoxide reductase/ Thiol specific antioxidant/ Mal allergen n=1 Tax=[Clostridium] ultunense Esp TaxID=1288971 RepID=M1Z5C7_9FIRM|nr:Alkyl hydroperoxide reductase/ Thiol specific antioxidant/ Mal allergen [[Clostridium] ultunense Esp]SHD78119.1 Alkyl hydroperoxide reductase/ Thiol specific antioxidant/ Mal allergen [[Clostridium] ultunense Esp]